MASGYIKLHRCLLDNPLFDNENLLKVWVWCLLKASHKEHEQLVGLQKVILKPGQFVFGRDKAAAELKLHPSSLYRYVKKLESSERLVIQPNNKFSIVTIENWAFYQGEGDQPEQQNEQQMNNKRTTNEQQMNTNKNVKNVKNEKNKDLNPPTPLKQKFKYAEFVSLDNDEYSSLVAKLGSEERFNRCVEILDNYKGASGKRYKSDYRAILNWVIARLEEEENKTRPSPIQKKSVAEQSLDRWVNGSD